MPNPDTPGVAFPPPLIFLGFLLLGFGLGRLVGEPSLGLDPALRRGAAFVLVIAGLALDGAAAGHFRRLGTPPEPWKPSTALATEGLYRFSRNPIYVGFAVTFLGFAIAMDSPLALVMLAPCLTVVDRFVIAREERYLERRFGAAYAEYRSRVRRWL